GIRDYKVTGVQTCALPIYRGPAVFEPNPDPAVRGGFEGVLQEVHQDLMDTERVHGADDGFAPEFRPDLHARFAERLRLLDSLADEVREVRLDRVDGARSGELQQFRRDARGNPSLGGDLFQAFLDLRIGNASGDARGQQRDVRERRINLVRDERCEPAHRRPAL